jgi:hypothetical protein
MQISSIIFWLVFINSKSIKCNSDINNIFAKTTLNTTMKYLLTFLSVCASQLLFAQVTGGESIFQFLRLPNSAHASAMGGMVVSNPSNDVSFGYSNPALLNPGMHNQLAINQNFYLAGSSYTNAMYAHHSTKWNTTFGGGISYMNYGKIDVTNTNGQIIGRNNASGVNMQINASKTYKNKWRYGAALKFVNVALASQQGNGVMADAGLQYADTTKQLYFGMVVKNIGFSTSRFTTQSEPLPFDMRIGITKKFVKAPFRINAIVHHLYQWDIRYDNPADQLNSSFFGNTDTIPNNYFADKLFRHFNFGIDVILGKRLEINVGYSHQRRGELALKEKLALAGFSVGANLYFPKFDIHYGRSIYALAGNYNDIGVNFKLKEAFGLGKSAFAISR